VLDPSDEDKPETQFDVVDRYTEPEESDPEAIGPAIPEAPDPTDEDVEVDSALLVSFWRLVVLFNVALLLTSVGLLFLIFEGALVLGGQLLVAGLLVGVYGLYRYRKAKTEVVEPAVAEAAEESAGPDDGSP
jgi:hypothetical protein